MALLQCSHLFYHTLPQNTVTYDQCSNAPQCTNIAAYYDAQIGTICAVWCIGKKKKATCPVFYALCCIVSSFKMKMIGLTQCRAQLKGAQNMFQNADSPLHNSECTELKQHNQYRKHLFTLKNRCWWMLVMVARSSEHAGDFLVDVYYKYRTWLTSK